MKQIISIALTAVVVTMLFVSCGTGGLDGTYLPKNCEAKNFYIAKLVFNEKAVSGDLKIDGNPFAVSGKGNTVKMYMGAMGMAMPVALEYRYSLEGNKLTIEGGIPGVDGGGIELTYNKAKDEISLLTGMMDGELDKYAPVWGKEGTVPKDPCAEQEKPKGNAPSDKNTSDGAGKDNAGKDNAGKEIPDKKPYVNSDQDSHTKPDDKGTSWTYNPYVYYQELAETCALYSALAYEKTWFMRLNRTVSGPVPPMSLSEYKTVKDENNIQYLYNWKDNKEPVVLQEQLKYDGYKGIISKNYHDENEHNISYTLAYKAVNDNENLLVVILRGTDYVEWRGNMDIGENNKRHYSFQKANDTLQQEIIGYIKTYSLTKINFLITGHSRGAAVANLLAVDMNENNPFPEKKNAYAYTFATPNNIVLTDEEIFAEIDDLTKNGSNIFNFVFRDDFVPQVPLSYIGWDYRKKGLTYSAVAENLYKINDNFKTLQSILMQLSEGRQPYFNYQKTHDVLKAFFEIAHTINDYYNTNPKLQMECFHGKTGEEDKTLYEFMRDYIANAAIGKLGSQIGVATKQSPWCNQVHEIGVFFVDGLKMANNVKDTHEAFTYYNALISGGFIPKD